MAAGAGNGLSAPHAALNGKPTDAYKTLDEIYAELEDLRKRFSHLVTLERIGSTSTYQLPIWAVRVSRNPNRDEDEPKILFTGVHHAREPIGAEISLHLMSELCHKYGTDEQVADWLNTTEVWFVPVVNPDGYKYVFDNGLTFPWWRKNLRDNDGDGVFDPLHDGVDLNRNYGINWGEGGDGKPNSWFFRGGAPFSENETDAIRKFVTREKFTMGVSYHSYGESILYPWGNFERPPDLDLIVDIAQDMAGKIRRQSGHGVYSILPLNGRAGQSSVWMYADLGTIDFIVEVGTEYFPAEEHIPNILREHTKAAFYLLQRLHGSGIRGHVVDAHEKKPLQAVIEVLGFESEQVRPRKSEPAFGTFHRVLQPGEYSLRVTCAGYEDKSLPGVLVEEGQLLEIDIGLTPVRHPSNGH